MSLPQNLEPPADPTPVAADPEVSEPDTEAPAVTVEEPETPEEVASDAALRSWAKDNGIEDVPASGRLSAAWRDQITAAMAAALDPKDEASAASDSSPESSTSVETMTETETSSTDQSNPDSTDEENPEPAPEPVVEYHSTFQSPNTFVTSQAFTS